MLSKRIIPCLDVKNGRVVKGTNFIALRDAGDPVECAKAYNEAGADELVFLDISATVEGRGTVVDMVKSVAEQVFIPFTVGGGIRSLEDIREILNAGADKISLNSAAVKDPELVRRASERFGSQCVVVAIDVRGRNGGQIRIAGTDADFKGIDENASEEDNSKFPSGYEVVVAGGTKATGLDALEWAKKVEELGAGEILLTSLDRDGTKSGFDNVITRMIADAVSIPVIASGGAGKMEDFYDGIVDGGADAVLASVVVGKAVHDLFQLTGLLADAGHFHQISGPAVVALQRLVQRARLGDGLAGALIQIGVLALPGGFRQRLHAVVQRQARAEDQRHLAAKAGQFRRIKPTFYLSGHLSNLLN